MAVPLALPAIAVPGLIFRIVTKPSRTLAVRASWAGGIVEVVLRWVEQQRGSVGDFKSFLFLSEPKLLGCDGINKAILESGAERLVFAPGNAVLVGLGILVFTIFLLVLVLFG